MDVDCIIQGNPDLYGKGIRVGLYLQWLAAIIASDVCPKEIPATRLAIHFFTAASFVALIMQTNGHPDLDNIEIYITLLLTFGETLSGVFILLWRFLIGFNARWDPSLFHRNLSRASTGPLLMLWDNLILSTVCVFQLWFWTMRVPLSLPSTCPRFGFIFYKVDLHNEIFRAVNIGLYLTFLVLRSVSMFLRYTPLASRTLPKLYNRLSEPKSVSQARANFYHLYNTVSNIIVSSIIIAATELCIRWNNIDGVSSITPPGQIIPFLIGLACLLRVLYSCARKYFLPEPINESAAPLLEHDVELIGTELASNGCSITSEQNSDSQEQNGPEEAPSLETLPAADGPSFAGSEPISNEHGHELEQALNSHGATEEATISTITTNIQQTGIQPDCFPFASPDENQLTTVLDVESGSMEDRRHDDVVVSYTHTYSERERKRHSRYYNGDGGHSSRQGYN